MDNKKAPILVQNEGSEETMLDEIIAVVRGFFTPEEIEALKKELDSEG